MEKNQFRGVILKKFENLSIYNSLTTHVSDLISSKVKVTYLLVIKQSNTCTKITDSLSIRGLKNEEK